MGFFFIINYFIFYFLLRSIARVIFKQYTITHTPTLPKERAGIAILMYILKCETIMSYLTNYTQNPQTNKLWDSFGSVLVSSVNS